MLLVVIWQLCTQLILQNNLFTQVHHLQSKIKTNSMIYHLVNFARKREK